MKSLLSYLGVKLIKWSGVNEDQKVKLLGLQEKFNSIQERSVTLAESLIYEKEPLMTNYINCSSAQMYKVLQVIHDELIDNKEAYDAYSDAIIKAIDKKSDIQKEMTNILETSVNNALIEFKHIEEARSAGGQIVGFSTDGELIIENPN